MESAFSDDIQGERTDSFGWLFVFFTLLTGQKDISLGFLTPNPYSTLQRGLAQTFRMSPIVLRAFPLFRTFSNLVHTQGPSGLLITGFLLFCKVVGTMFIHLLVFVFFPLVTLKQ